MKEAEAGVIRAKLSNGSGESVETGESAARQRASRAAQSSNTCQWSSAYTDYHRPPGWTAFSAIPHLAAVEQQSARLAMYG